MGAAAAQAARDHTSAPLVEAIVRHAIVLDPLDWPPRVIAELQRKLTFRARSRPGAAARTVACWDDEADGRLSLPRGATALVRDTLRRHGLGWRVQDRTVAHAPRRWACNVTPRRHQEAALRAVIDAVQGYVVMPCGAGKTILGVLTIAALGQPALIVVHTGDLATQWEGEVRTHLGIEPGRIGEGRSDVQDVTVATVQSLARLGAAELDALGERFGLVILDEAHHAPADTFRAVLHRLPARHRLGLTATPEREDGMGPMLGHYLGRKAFEVTHAELLEAGLLVPVEVRCIDTGFKYDYPPARGGDHDAEDRARYLQKAVAALTKDPERNALIVDLALADVARGHSVLVLSSRVEHCRTLAATIEARGVHAGVLVGATSAKARAALLDGLRDGSVPVVVGTAQLADEGLDVPRLDRLILTTPTRAAGRAVQRLGRLARVHADKSAPVLYDLVDRDVVQALNRRKRGLLRPLELQWGARRRAYLSAGANIVEGT